MGDGREVSHNIIPCQCLGMAFWSRGATLGCLNVVVVGVVGVE